MKPIPPIKAYKVYAKSDLSDEAAIRLVTILKKGSIEDGVAVMKSLRWSIDKALRKRRYLKVKHHEKHVSYYWLCDESDLKIQRILEH